MDNSSTDLTQDQPVESAIGVEASTKAPRSLTPGEQTTLAVVVTMIAVLGLIGFTNSYFKVEKAAQPFFGDLSWTVPLGIDIGIFAFSALDIILSRLDVRVRILRYIPWALTGATVYLNIADETAPFAIVAHAILPMLWVVAVETGAHVLRKFAGLASPVHMDSIRKSRWIFALPSTFFLWRRMILWEVRSYPVALRRERDRVLAKTDLQDKYGMLWRFKASRRERALFKLGELVPTTFVPEDDAPVPDSVPVVAAEDEVTVPEFMDDQSSEDERTKTEDEAARPRGRRRTKEQRTEDRPLDVPEDEAPKRKTVLNVDDLIPLGTEVAEELLGQDRRITRDNVIEVFRHKGHPISTNRATALLPKLKALYVPAQPGEQLDLVEMAGTER